MGHDRLSESRLESAVLWAVVYVLGAAAFSWGFAGGWNPVQASVWWAALLLPNVFWRRGWVVPLIAMGLYAVNAAHLLYILYEYGWPLLSLHPDSLVAWSRFVGALACIAAVYLTRNRRRTVWGRVRAAAAEPQAGGGRV